MNRLSRIFVVSLSVAGLAACASMDEQSASIAPQSSSIGVDGAYVGRVEEIARRRGIEVMWVNPPTERQLIADE
ncbi:hypothetical protein [Lysobacter sp. F60174L2]|uniref:hypothetical protein n=1 Tax=Lysobacter sp. F60174L2 TaxID=3459295 RepID=UPI00403DC12A